jgi:dCMP deaminase
MNWDDYLLDLAEAVRQKSKDPSSKIGAVLVKDHAIISTGFNGFPIGVDETDPSRWQRPQKYQYVCHAERNAIALAARQGIATAGATLYMVGMGPPTMPCTECAKLIIQAGIKRVVGRAFKPLPESWVADLDFASGLLSEAGVEFCEVAPCLT